MMRRRLLVLLALLGLSTWAAFALAAPAAPIKLVSDVWPPFTDEDKKPHEALDLVQGALQRAALRSTSTIMTFSAALAGLEQGKFDGSAALWKTPERERYLLFSKPYLENRLLLVARKGESVAFSRMAELRGKRLALTRGYGYGDAVTKAPGVQIVYRDSDTECLRAVLAKEADYLLLDELMVRHLYAFYADKANELIVPGLAPIVRYPLHFALRKDYPNAAKIMADFDRNIERMMADGTYNVVLHVPWIATDTNGDGVPEFVTTKKKLAPQQSGDPAKNFASYPVFYPEPTAPNMNRTPTYLVDGKSYNTWGDAATTLNRSGPTQGQGLYKYSTGFVLGEF
jgi:polar amino acid transport system substrate-binding protein